MPPRNPPGSTLLQEHRRLVTAVADLIEPDLDGDRILAGLRELWKLGDEWEKAANRLADLLDEANAA